MKPLSLANLSILFLLTLCNAEAREPLIEDSIPLTLDAIVPGPSQRGVGWSPKGEKIPLKVSQEHDASNERRTTYDGQLILGKKLKAAVQFRLPSEIGKSAEVTDSPRAELWVDLDGNGQFDESERSEAAPKLSRGKYWLSFAVVLRLETSESEEAHPRPYPISLWFVYDPADSSTAPVLRWSRRGWHTATFELEGRKCDFVISDRDHDGVFTVSDGWGLKTSTEAWSYSNSGYSASSHAWLGETAYKLAELDSEGRTASIEVVDIGMTREEEKAAKDPFREDKAYPRAKKPVVFTSDLAAALDVAKQKQQRVLVDFVTTWCGPCKSMDKYVYTAEPLAVATKEVVCVQLDGDEEKEIVKKYQVEAYPTLLVLDAEGEVLQRRVGYQGVKAMLDLLSPKKEDD